MRIHAIYIQLWVIFCRFIENHIHAYTINFVACICICMYIQLIYTLHVSKLHAYAFFFLQKFIFLVYMQFVYKINFACTCIFFKTFQPIEP